MQARITNIFAYNYYEYAILIDGNDPRRIDVGLLNKYKIKSISTNIYEPYSNAEGTSASSPLRKYLFSRDCLEGRSQEKK